MKTNTEKTVDNISEQITETVDLESGVHLCYIKDVQYDSKYLIFYNSDMSRKIGARIVEITNRNVPNIFKLKLLENTIIIPKHYTSVYNINNNVIKKLIKKKKELSLSISDYEKILDYILLDDHILYIRKIFEDYNIDFKDIKTIEDVLLNIYKKMTLTRDLILIYKYLKNISLIIKNFKLWS